MKHKNKSKLPYIAFSIRVLTYLFILWFSIVFYLDMRKDASTLPLQLFALSFPVIALGIIAFDSYFRIKDIKEYRKKHSDTNFYND